MHKRQLMDLLAILERFMTVQRPKEFEVAMVNWYVGHQNEIGLLWVPDGKC